MKRKAETIAIVLFALAAGVVGGGVTSSRATRLESRRASASCAAKFCRSCARGRHSDGDEPKLHGRRDAHACASPFAGRCSRADGHWAGWLYATDADTGVWKWRLKSNYPIMGAVTPTAGRGKLGKGMQGYGAAASALLGAQEPDQATSDRRD
jgi:hypothetical protein